MRDARRRLAKHSRRQRRVILAVIMMAGAPVMADGPRFNSVHSLPPLPLKSITDGNLVHSNPFCQPTPAARKSAVQQASGSDASSIRLKPIGAAIGLHSIDSSSPIAAQSPAMTIENVGPAAVRNNPLVESTHHANPELVDTKVIDRATISPPTIQRPGGGESTILLIPSAEIKPDVFSDEPAQSEPAQSEPAQSEPAQSKSAQSEPELAESPAAPAESTLVQEPVLLVDEPTLVDNPAFAGPAIPPLTAPPSQPTAEPLNPDQADEAIEPAEMEPVFFSLSDRSDSADNQQDPLPNEVVPAEPFDVAGTSEPEQVSEFVEVAEVPELTEVVEVSEQHIDLNDALDVPSRSADDSVQLSVVEPLDLGDSFLLPIDSVEEPEPAAPIAIYRSEPARTLTVESPEATLHTRRYRPPVAVKPVPLAFERPKETSDVVVRPAVQPVKGLYLEGPAMESQRPSKLTPLYLSRAQVRSLTVGGKVRGVKVADKNVCQAFSAGPNQLKLIGTGNGVTRLVVWADTDDIDKPTRMRTFEIHVNDAVDTNGDAVGNKAELLNHTIRKAFPHCSVTVKPYRDQLVVAGRCDSETSAKQIIRMVRKTCLVPVQDKLVVR